MTERVTEEKYQLADGPPPTDRPAEATEPKPKPKPTHVRELPCKLTDEERMSLGDKIAELVGEAEDIEAEKKSIASSYKAKADKISERIQALSRQLLRGTVDRDVEVTIEQDLAHAEEIITRIDTGEVVSRKTLTALEMQRLQQTEIPGSDEPQKPPETWESLLTLDEEAPEDAQLVVPVEVVEVVDKIHAEIPLTDVPHDDLRAVVQFVKDHPDLKDTPEFKAISRELDRRAKGRKGKQGA
jgi:hypothetical protein